MPHLLFPPGNTQPAPADVAELLDSHDYGLIAANLLGPASGLLPHARTQRSWSLQERLRDAGFSLLRLPCSLHDHPSRSSGSSQRADRDMFYIPVDTRDRGTLQDTLVRLARSFGQSHVWVARRGKPQRELELSDEIPLATDCADRLRILADGQLSFTGTLLECSDYAEWLPRPDNWISRLACQVIAKKDWRALSVVEEDRS